MNICGRPKLMVRAFASRSETRIIFINSLPITPVPVHRIGDVIATSDNLKALARQAQRLKELQHLLFVTIPPALAAASRVTNLRSGTLVLSADNAAVAAKLRQLAPRLLLHVREQETEVTGIRVVVQVKTHKIKAEH